MSLLEHINIKPFSELSEAAQLAFIMDNRIARIPPEKPKPKPKTTKKKQTTTGTRKRKTKTQSPQTILDKINKLPEPQRTALLNQLKTKLQPNK